MQRVFEQKEKIQDCYMRKVILIAGALLCCGVSWAQTEAVKLTFEEAYRRMVNDNPQMDAMQHEEKAAEQERKAAIGLRFPQIGVIGAYVHLGDDIGMNFNGIRDGAAGAFGDMATYLGANGITLPQPVIDAAGATFSKDWGGLTLLDQDLGYVGGTVTLPVYMGGKINAANRAARINSNTVVQKSAQTQSAMVSELVERYYGASLALSVVKVRQQVLDAVNVHLKDAIAMEESGMIARSERLYMEVKVSEAERDLMAAQLQAETILSALNNTINSDTQHEPVSYMFMMRELRGLDYYRDLALSNNPLLKQVELKRDLAVENVKLQRAELLPQVAIMGGGRVYNYHISKHMPKWAVGVGIKFNIFDGWHKEHKLNSAKSTVRQVDALEDKARKDIAVLVEKTYNEMRNYYDRMPSIDKSLEFANEYLRVKRAGFREGVASSVDVIDAELNLAKTRIERLQAAYYYDLMLARLLEIAGDSESFLSYARSGSAIPIMF